MDELFSFSTNQEDLEEIEDVKQIIADFPILQKTRESSKCWQDLFHSMHQIVAGTFLCAHKFDDSWMAKVLGRWDVYEIKFTWCELIKRTRDILEYITERKPQGFWYPRNGKISLPEFFCSEMKNGKCWSPFLELNFLDFATPMMYRKMFGPKICSKLDEILPDCWFTLDFDGKVRFYKGVDNLHDWFCDLPYTFVNKCDENRLAFSKFSGFLELLRQCNKETGCVYPNFIGPNSPKWSVFVEWLKSRKHVEWSF